MTWKTTVVGLCGLLFSSPTAWAQPAAPSVEAPADTPAPQAEAAPAQMAGFGIGIKLGYLSYGASDLNADSDAPAGVGSYAPSARGGTLLSVPMTFGASFGFTLEPYLGLGDLDSAGMYLGPHFNIQIQKVYVGSGLGVRAGYLSSEYFSGVDLHARIPLRATYYVVPKLGLIAELGLGYGVSGVMPDVPDGVPSSDFEFGVGMQVDFSVGARFR